MHVDDAVRRWREMSRMGRLSARLLFETGGFRGCANRAYYSAYHASTSLCVARGAEFPHGWNNPSHDQLPELIHSDGHLLASERRAMTRLLRVLREEREVLSRSGIRARERA